MDTVQVSGPGRQLAAVQPWLADAGVDLLVVLFRRKSVHRHPYAELLVGLGIPHVIAEDRGRFDPALTGTVRRLLDEWRPDIVQTHSYRPTALAWLLRRRGVSWRWVGFFHGTTHEDRKVRLYHWLDRRLLRAADRIVVMSGPQAELFARSGRPVRRIHNAVLPAPTAALPEDVASVLSAVPHPRVGVIGRLSPEKGVDVLLAALAEGRAQLPRVHVVIAGDGPERRRLVAQASALGLGDRVHFLGPVYPATALYPELDLVVLPSRSEGLPNVLLEALEADRPVVATDVGAVSEVLVDPAAGVVVPPENPTLLASAIARALAEPPGQGSAARRAAAARFSLDQRVEAHLALYRELVPDGGAIPAGAGA